MEEGWLQVWCYSYRGAITSDMSADPVSLSDMHVCVVQLQACMLGSFIQICVFVRLHKTRHLLQIHQTCLQVYKICRLPSWMPS